MSKAVAEIAAGVALIAVDVVFLGANPVLIGAGASLIAGGIGTLLTRQQQGLGANVQNPIQPWNVAYGQAKLGGTVIYSETTGDTDEFWHIIYVLAAHPCQSLDAVLFDQKRICLDTSGNSLSFQDSTPVIASQQTVSISSISRTNDVVTVVMASAMPLPASTAAGPALVTGDTVQIKNVTADDTLNGRYVIQLVNSTTFTYICGGNAVSVTGQGQVETDWPDWGDTVHMEVALGNQSSGSPPFPGLLAGGPTGSNGLWTSNHLLLGRTAVYLRLKYSDGKEYVNGIPNIAFVVSGKNDIYDPRLGDYGASGTTGYTTNSALCIADFLTNQTWGFKCVYDTDVPTRQLISAANICDESVTLASGGTESRYTCNGSFQLNAKRGEILENLLTSCAGRITYAGGQFIIWPAAWYGGAASFLEDGLANFGSNSALYVQGDWSAGLWINLPSDAHGSLIAMVDAGSTDPSAAAPYVLTVTGGPDTFGIEYVHDYGTVGGIAGHEFLPFAANIPVNTWTYIGVSRNSTAKTVTLYTSNGTTITTIGTLSYSNTPGIEPGLAELTLGEFNYGSMATTPNNSLFYPAISEIASAYMWNSDLTSAQHLSAAQGSPTSTGLIFDVSNVGATPPTSTTAATGTISSTLINTAVVNGPSSPNTARLFGQTVGTTISPSITNMAGPFQWKPKASVRDLYNGVKATYVCPANNWQASDMPPYAQDADHGYSSDANLAADGGERRWLDLQFPFTISTATAQRLAKIELLRRRYQGTGTFVFNLAMYQLTALDVVSFNLATLGWTEKLLEITNHRFTVSEQNTETGGKSITLGTEIDVQETDPSIYDWSTSEELNAEGFRQSTTDSAKSVAAPTGVTATNSTVTGTGVTGDQIQITWNAPTDGFVTGGGYTIVQYSLDDTNWIPLGQFDSSTNSTFIPRVAAGQSYWVRVAFVNVAGVQSAWTVYGPIIATGDSLSIRFADNETPAGARDGVNQTYSLLNAPNPPDSLELFLNGDLQCQGLDYGILGQVITMLTSAPDLTKGDWFRAWYKYSPIGAGSGGTSTSPLIFSDSTSVPITHNLNTFNLSPGVWDSSGNVLSYSSLQLTDANDALLSFVGAAQSGVVVMSPTAYQQTIPGGTASVAIPHNLNSLNIIPVLYDSNWNQVEFTTLTLVDANNATLKLSTAFPGGTLELLSPVGAYSQTVPSGVTSLTVTHNLGTVQLRVALYDASNNLIRFNSFGPINTNSSTLTLAVPLASPGRIVVQKP